MLIIISIVCILFGTVLLLKKREISLFIHSEKYGDRQDSAFSKHTFEFLLLATAIMAYLIALVCLTNKLF